jgi:hypothetical protein
VKFGDAKVTPFMSIEGPTDWAPRAAKESPVAQRSRDDASEYAEMATQMKSIPRDGIFSELMLVQPPRWRAGLWGDEQGGWCDARTNLLLSFDDARQLIADRISELGLSPELVHAFPSSVRNNVEDRALWKLSFDQRMDLFRAAE